MVTNDGHASTSNANSSKRARANDNTIAHTPTKKTHTPMARKSTANSPARTRSRTNSTMNRVEHQSPHVEKGKKPCRDEKDYSSSSESEGGTSSDDDSEVQKFQ